MQPSLPRLRSPTSPPSGRWDPIPHPASLRLAVTAAPIGAARETSNEDSWDWTTSNNPPAGNRLDRHPGGTSR